MSLSKPQKIILLGAAVLVFIFLGANIKSPDVMCSFYGFELICLSNTHPLIILTKYRPYLIIGTLLLGIALFKLAEKK